MNERPRYQTDDPALDQRLHDLLETAGATRDVDQLFEILVTVVGLAGDEADRLNLKITNAALREMREAFKVFAPYRHIPKVTIFGSARTLPDDPLYVQTRDLAVAARSSSTAAAIRDQTHALAVAVEELRAASALMRDATSRLTGTPVSPPGPPVIDERNARYDRQTIEIMRRVLAPDSNVIDVGAHAGSVLEQIVALAPDGTHAAFEPIGSLAAALRERFPSVEVHEMALSDTTGETTFHHVVSNPSYSGILKRRFDRDHEDVEVVTVPVGRLDDVIPADRPVKLLKIDVEGAELGVLRGGEKLITSHKPYVVFEHGLGGSDIYGTEPGTVYDLLEGWGLRISLLDDWLHSRPPLTRDAFVEQFVECINYYFLAHPG